MHKSFSRHFSKFYVLYAKRFVLYYLKVISDIFVLFCFLNLRESTFERSDCNGTRTHNRLVRKVALNHLAKLASLDKWLSVP